MRSFGFSQPHEHEFAAASRKRSATVQILAAAHQTPDMDSECRSFFVQLQFRDYQHLLKPFGVSSAALTTLRLMIVPGLF